MKNQYKNHRTFCIRCGTCCIKGGPVLHHEDKKILLEGHAGHQHLVTIRKGEMALNPASNKLELIKRELVKVIGKGKEWSCYFYNEKKASCEIYDHRFIECRLLKCWDTSELKAVVGKNTIIRADIINSSDPIMTVIETHEKECPCYELERLISEISRGKYKSRNLERLTEMVRKDISIRSYARSELGLKEEFEPFIFGRPFFEIITTRGLTSRISDDSPGKRVPEKR
ncbi:MAG: YkgJ family cysteine cluster protein [Nitrospirae bacterium]|jgi:Fe-S-cluster containining protein|nr:YkgJ family cysteine cluster protein [Nitrospirota bacterium]